MKNIVILVFGAIVALFSLWVGSWLMFEIPRDSWMHFPAFFTSVFFFLIGVCFAVFGFTNRSLD